MFIYPDQQVGKGLARTDEERYAFVSPYSVGQRKVNRSADSRQGQSKKIRVQNFRMHVIHTLFVTIIAAGLIVNEWRSKAFSQKIRLIAPVCAAFAVIELA